MAVWSEKPGGPLKAFKTRRSPGGPCEAPGRPLKGPIFVYIKGPEKEGGADHAQGQAGLQRDCALPCLPESLEKAVEELFMMRLALGEELTSAYLEETVRTVAAVWNEMVNTINADIIAANAKIVEALQAGDIPERSKELLPVNLPKSPTALSKLTWRLRQRVGISLCSVTKFGLGSFSQFCSIRS